MNETMILHHYENSPYAEKIRLMFGYTNSEWCSLVSPAWPPRPNVDPLSGGYRRIPIAQVGADIFCDSALIAEEIAMQTQQPALDPRAVDGVAAELMMKVEGEGFFAAITSIPAPKLLGTMLRNFGPLGAYRFVKDRSGILKGGTVKAKSAADAQAVMREIFHALEQLLSSQDWVGGAAPNAADFAIYHPIWLHLNCMGKIPQSAKKTLGWYERIGNIGQGQRREITQAEAFDRARSAAPRPLPAIEPSSDSDPSSNKEAGPPVALGTIVAVQPKDYGVVAVTGELASVTDDRIIVARHTADFGTLHVHFPRRGYSLTESVEAGPAQRALP